jgi:hypothetical protein
MIDNVSVDVDQSGIRPQRWTPAPEWVISRRPAHPALVSEADLVAVQGIRAVHRIQDGARSHLLAGLLRCAVCGRRMDCHWVNDRAGYRCRHGRTSAHTPGNDGDPRQVAARLRTEEITIVCDRRDRRLSRDLP